MPLENWPGTASVSDRRRLILEALAGGKVQLDWCSLILTDGENTLVVKVTCDALKIDNVRISMDAETQQLVADEIGALLLTPKLVDQIYAQAPDRNRLRPKPQNVADLSTAAMISYSTKVDAGAGSQGVSTPPALTNVGKDWVLVKSLFSSSARTAEKAANYGWLVDSDPWGGISTERAVSLPGAYAIQGVGTAHNNRHVDYSQNARYAQRQATYNGQPVDLADVYTGRAPGTNLVSHEGPLPDYKQPTRSTPPTTPLTPPPTKPPPKTPPPPGAPPTPAAATVTTGGGAGTPIALSLLGAGAGAVAGTGAAGVGIGALAGLVLGFALRPKRRTVTVPSAPSAPMQEVLPIGGVWCSMVATKRYIWDESVKDWIPREDWRYYLPGDYSLIAWADPLPFLSEIAFCRTERETWELIHVQTNY